MERFPRGTIPREAFAVVATLAPTAVTAAPSVVAADLARPAIAPAPVSAP